jgi:imidazolonepropionase-like amidohydrolase
LQAGIKIGAGTDSGSVSHILGSSLHLELQLMVDYGMTPAAALHTATGAAAEILGQEAQLGTLEVGKLADILIVDGDPLVDIGATRAIWLVLKDGQIVVDKRMQ